MKRKAKHSIIEDDIKEVKREWRSFLKFNDENRLVSTAFVVVLSSLLIVNAIFILNQFGSTTTKSATPMVESHRYVTSHAVAKNGAMTAKISNVTENNKQDYAFTIDPSETMLIMDIVITNETKETQHLLPSIQLYARSLEGDYAQLHASMYVTDPLPAKDLKPGETAKGQISFNVPKHIGMPLVYIDTGWDNYGPIIFDALH